MIFTSHLPMPAMDPGPSLRAIAAAALPRHLTCGRRHWRLHHNPPCSGSARKGAANLISGIFQPAKVAVHPAGSERLAEPRGTEILLFRQPSEMPLQEFRHVS